MWSEKDSPKKHAIHVKGLGKAYHIYDRPIDRFLQIFDNKQHYREFWAIRDASFDVCSGESVGIIGRNGSGKSTLLQLIAGTLTPTEGAVRVGGRVAALLELGSGFNPEFTGRENVSLNAAVLGLSRAEIQARFSKIIEFSELGDFIDQPVKTYSSGMMMRLAFSVIAHVDADILVIDEALAVGDAFFTQKCMRYIKDFREKGTLLFVSHDAGAVSALCDRAIWIDNGKIQRQGEVKGVLNAYLEAFVAAREGADQTGASRKRMPSRAADSPRDIRADLVDRSTLRNDLRLTPFDPEAPSFGEMHGNVTDVALVDAFGQELRSICGGEDVVLEISVRADTVLESPIIGFYLKDRLGQLLFGDNTYLATLDNPLTIPPGGCAVAKFHFNMPRLQRGDYFVTAGLAVGTQDTHIIQHWVHEALSIKSEGQGIPVGIIGLPMQDISLDVVAT